MAKITAELVREQAQSDLAWERAEALAYAKSKSEALMAKARRADVYGDHPRATQLAWECGLWQSILTEGGAA